MNQVLTDYAHMSASDQQFIEELYQSFLQNPESVDQSWRYFFQGLNYSRGFLTDSTQANQSVGNTNQASVGSEKLQKEFRVFKLIQSYRTRGHLLSQTNPVRPRKDRDARLSLQTYELGQEDLGQKFFSGHFVGLGEATLTDIIDYLNKTYCRSIGVEYMHVTNTDMRRWLRQEFEGPAMTSRLPLEKKKRILFKLNEAVVFENFLQTKYIGQKRFSLEGGETLIPALDALINTGADLNAKEFVFGMAHRGRLNVLANTVGKTYEFIFKEFAGQKNENQIGSGDVKYHMGYTSVRKTVNDKDVVLKLLPNPSHLETVGPVVLGYSRSLIDNDYKDDKKQVVPILIHGDAALAGQGVVYEVAQMSKLPAYQTGGTIHFVINNQIGFTTDFEEGRSSIYCTAVGRVVDSPIFHVNGDDPEAVVQVCELAMKFRQTFHQDVYIDMVCYRKYGHNEGDEPRYTQPHLYKLIGEHHNPREVYLKKLMDGKEIEADLAEKMKEEFNKMLSDRFNNVQQKQLPGVVKGPHKQWDKMRFSDPKDFHLSPDTGVKKEILQKIVLHLSTIPEHIQPISKVKKLLSERMERFEQDQIDWAMGELLSYGSILLEKKHVRFTGQDVVRGTFSHRHAMLFDETKNLPYCNLNHIEAEGEQGKLRIYNSLLSEYAVLGFEYGYAMADPHQLVIWEAQFGDFANGAQIMIDQFIAAAETKWNRMNGLVMLLPHGQEGQGPEHSSARLERFLQLCAEDNMYVLNCSNPANLFHALRRQLVLPFRKPLVVMSPKSLLRHPQCVSKVQEFVNGRFQEVIDDVSFMNAAKAKKVSRVLFCSGKVYYDLIQKREELKKDDVAIVRVEQFYPVPHLALQEMNQKYAGAKKVWVQEEPKNMGAWMHWLLNEEVSKEWSYVGRDAAAAPAVGYQSTYQQEQKILLEKAINGDK